MTYAMGNTDTYGVQFRAASAFTGCEVYVSAVPAEGGSLTLSLYAWAGNYAKSIAEKPCAGATVTGIRRGSWVTLPGDFKAGEYLLVLSGGSDSLAVEMREARTDRSVTYLHTSASGLSLVSRLTGTDIFHGKAIHAQCAGFCQLRCMGGNRWAGAHTAGQQDCRRHP